MTDRLSRQQRRQLERAAAGVDHVTAEDRAWFEAHPDRRFRIRRMAAAEIASCAAIGSLNPIAPRAARFTLVRKVTSDARMRIFIHGPADRSGNETSEGVAAALWEHHRVRSPISQAREKRFVALMADYDAPRGAA